MCNLAINKIFQQFAELLENRFSKQTYTTEDSIRYTLFYCLTCNGGIHPSDIILEYPHPAVPKAKIDSYILPKKERSGLVFEFKFDREIPSGRNPPKPQKAGKIFADIFRLALFKLDFSVQRYFIYLTDNEMAFYFQNPYNQLRDFFELTPEEHIRIDRRYIEKHSNTFIKSASNNICNCDVICRLSKEFISEFWLRIYEIKSINI